MKKQFILSKIEAVQDGSPYVYVGFIDPNDSRAGEARQQNPFGPKAMAFSSPEDLMKNRRNDGRWWPYRFSHIQIKHERI